jgi:hypothetical protein
MNVIQNNNNWTMPKNTENNSYFNRGNLSRQSKVKNENFSQSKNVIYNENRQFENCLNNNE